MIKTVTSLVAVAVLLTSFVASATAEESASPFAKYVGEWEVNYVSSDGNTGVYDLFMIDEDGEITGAVEDSGYSGFVGTVTEDGKVVTHFTQIDGSMEGTIDAEGVLTGKTAAHGINATFTGKKK